MLPFALCSLVGLEFLTNQRVCAQRPGQFVFGQPEAPGGQVGQCALGELLRVALALQQAVVDQVLYQSFTVVGRLPAGCQDGQVLASS